MPKTTMEAIGVDIVAIKRIQLKTRLIEKILHPDEIVLLTSKPNVASQKQFLAGRWAIKEAVLKTLSEPIAMNQINIGYQNDKPVILNDWGSQILISISHEKLFAVGMALKKV